MIAAEAGGRELRACMREMPCGCDEIANAERKYGGDPSIVGAIVARGRAMQEAWQCPCVGNAEPAEAPAECKDTLQYVENALGVSGFKTCPLYYTRAPWVWHIVDLYQARKLGLRSALDPDPSLVTVEALLTLDSAINKRRNREAKRRAKAIANKEQPDSDDDDED